jgi:polyisoprenoid-binding protein YceI
MWKLLLFLFSCGLACANQIEIRIKLNPSGSFNAKSDALKVEGELKVAAAGFSVKNITLPLETLETGLSLRNEHMKKKYFEVERYPEATLVEAVGSQGNFKGRLEVHGVQREIEGKYQIQEGVLETQFPCRLSDFRIKAANYMGVGVEDEVLVHAAIPVNR